MTDEVKRLLKIKIAAERIRSDIYDMIYNERSDAIREIDRSLEEKYGAKRESAARAVADATKAMEDAEIAEASEKAPWPIGTKLIGWAKPNDGWSSRSLPWEVVAEGVLELVTHDTVHPAGMTYSRASLGTYIVRLVRKDGKIGTRYEEFGRVRSKKWLPVGEKPKDAK